MPRLFSSGRKQGVSFVVTFQVRRFSLSTSFKRDPSQDEVPPRPQGQVQRHRQVSVSSLLNREH